MKAAIQRSNILSKNEDEDIKITFNTYNDLFNYKMMFDKLIKSVPQFIKDDRDNLRRDIWFYQIFQEYLTTNAEYTNFDLIKEKFIDVSERVGKLGPYHDKLIESYDKTFCGQHSQNVNDHCDTALKNFNKLRFNSNALHHEVVKQTSKYEIMDIERNVYLESALITKKHIRRLAKYHRACLAELEASDIALNETVYYLENLDLEAAYEGMLIPVKTEKVAVELSVSNIRRPVNMKTTSSETDETTMLKAKHIKNSKIHMKTMERLILTPCCIASSSLEFMLVEKKLFSSKSVTREVVSGGISVLIPCKRVVKNVCRYIILASYRYTEDGIVKTKSSFIKSNPIFTTIYHDIIEPVYIYSEALKFKIIEGGYKNRQTKDLFQRKEIDSIYFTTICKKNKRQRKLAKIEKIASKETYYSLFVKLIVTRRRYKCYISEINSSFVSKKSIKEVTIKSKINQPSVCLPEKIIKKPAIIDLDFMTQLHSEKEWLNVPSQRTKSFIRSSTEKFSKKKAESKQLEDAHHKKPIKKQRSLKAKKDKSVKLKTVESQLIKKEQEEVRPKINVRLAKMTRRQVLRISEDFLCYERSKKELRVSTKSSDSESSIRKKSLRMSIDQMIPLDDSIFMPVEQNKVLKEPISITSQIEKIEHEMPIAKKVDVFRLQSHIMLSDSGDLSDLENFVDLDNEFIPLLPKLSSIPALNQIIDDDLFAKPNSIRKTSLSVSSIQPLHFPN